MKNLYLIGGTTATDVIILYKGENVKCFIEKCVKKCKIIYIQTSNALEQKKDHWFKPTAFYIFLSLSS